MKMLSWVNFKQNFGKYLPALLILGLGTALINIVWKLQKQMDNQLQRNVAGIDCLIGAKGSPIQLTMANIYHLDDPTGNISIEKATIWAKNPFVAKAIPLAYGDNHKGYKLLGTTVDYLQHFEAKIVEGRYATSNLEVVVGQSVVSKFGIKTGYTFYSNHGAAGGHEHKENQYVVVGVLGKTNSVLDNLLLTSIGSFWKTHHIEDVANNFDEESFEIAKYLNQKAGFEFKNTTIKSDSHQEEEEYHHENHAEEEHEQEDSSSVHDDDEHEEYDAHGTHAEHEEKDIHKASEKQITALLLKFSGPAGYFLPNQINKDEELMAINPSQTVLKFMTVLGMGYSTVNSIAVGVIFVAVITLFLTLLQIFNDRKYELALLRTMGASKWQLIKSLLGELFILLFVGFLSGILITVLTFEILPYFVEKNVFEGFQWQYLGRDELILFGICLVSGMVSVLFPLYKVYKIDLSKTLASEN
jgi:putative ABC transport system permease protein